MEDGVKREEFVQAVSRMADQVWDFHERWGLPPFDGATRSPQESIAKRQPILDEEIAELAEAVASGAATEIADEAADVLFVALGHVQSLLEIGVDGMGRVTAKNAGKTELTHRVRPDTGKLLPLAGKPHKWR